jgi:hypothetical protein
MQGNDLSRLSILWHLIRGAIQAVIEIYRFGHIHAKIMNQTKAYYG